MVADPLGELLWWCDRAGRDPDSALRRARRRLSSAAYDTEVRLLARHVTCLASLEQGRIDRARRHARIGVGVAHRLGMPERLAQLRLTLAWTELESGAGEACREQLRAAEPLLPVGDRPKAVCLRGLLFLQGDRYGDAIAELTGALHCFERQGNRHWAANALTGRGLARLSTGEFGSSDTDLAEAGRLFAAEGRDDRAAVCEHHRARVALRAGDLPRALQGFSQALAAGLDTEARPEARADRAEALAAVGMSGTARAEMEDVIVRLSELGGLARLAETRLALASCELRDGDARAALESARVARRTLRDQCRPAWSALAVATEWRARVALGNRSRRTLTAARKAAASCAAHGWSEAATELWFAAGCAARRAGKPSLARKLLTSAASCRRERAVRPPQRVIGWLAAALLAEQDGDHCGVFDACDSGLRVFEDHTAAVGGLDSRAQTFAVADELVGTAIGAALSTADPRLVLWWNERCRLGRLQRDHPVPSCTPSLRRALDELRATAAKTSEEHARRSPTEVPGITALEDRVRERAVLVGGRTGGSAPVHDADLLPDELGDVILVSYFVHDSVVHSVTLVDGAARLSCHGSEQTLDTEVDRLRYCLQRQSTATDPRIVTAFTAGARRTAESLGRRLLEPVRRELERGRALVVVPTGRLHALPWASLPTCRGSEVTVSPSLRCWLRARSSARQPSAGRSQVWVAGPGPQHARREVRALHADSGGRLLLDSDATTEKVLSSVDGAEVVHIAAHGWFRDDRPLLSHVELADGPLYAHDLDRLWCVPTTVVLSACEVGCSAVNRGDELKGIAAALLERGTATVIASLVSVPDERTAEVMVDLHAGLRRGLGPAAALAGAQDRHGESGFVCLGYGGR